jgi:hypothetical protein
VAGRAAACLGVCFLEPAWLLLCERHHDGSAPAARPLTQPWSRVSVNRRFLPLPPAFFIAREVPFFAEADFEEDQQQASAESRRHQDNREDFARHSFDQGGTCTPCHDQRSGRPKRDDA